MPARRTTQAVKVGTAKGQQKSARRAGGVAGRVATGPRFGMTDAALAANNRGSGGKGAPGIAGASSGGGGGGGRSPLPPNIEEYTRPAGGGAALPPRGTVSPIRRALEPISFAGGTDTTRTVRAMPTPAKPPVVPKKKPAAKKPAAKKKPPAVKRVVGRKSPNATNSAAGRRKASVKKPVVKRVIGRKTR